MSQNPASADASEIALAPGMFAQLQDTTKGSVRTYVGPTLINQTGQEMPAIYDHKQRIFRECGLREAIRKMPIAVEGDYLVLENPAKDDKHPNLGEPKQDCPDLRPGSKVNVPGPTQFALWPGQHATVVPGHNLRSNQYLECRVYNETAATGNWQGATIRKVETRIEEDAEVEVEVEVGESRQFIAGQRIIIRGDQVSFFIPPTGIEVLASCDDNYVREAVTLERLEYCILVDEDGNKRYERGPQVVFPEPTEAFLIDNERRKFRAFELNPIQGIHIKVIAGYTDEGDDKDNTEHSEGEELFITGEQQPIYFPRPEHSIIKYGSRNKQFATAVPPGEGRYLMDRLTGVIETKDGPDMLLPDPRNQVIVKRILTDRQSDLWYPCNSQSAEYNRELSKAATSSSTQSLGYLESIDSTGSVTRSLSEPAGKSAIADEFSRSTQYAPPRTLTIDTKFEGVPQICPWNGYAVMVVDKSGRRRVELGPTTILLKFDEDLEILTLSTGKPKNTDDLKSTVYLRVKNNKISDIVQNVLTADHVPVDIKLSFTVDFEGEPEKWFDIENYVKFMCDHVRSVLKGRIRKIGIKEFWASGADIVRDFVLGAKPADGDRPGMVFKQNGMRITDLEILMISIKNDVLGRMLEKAEEDVVADNIKLEKAERDLVSLKRQEEIIRATLKAKGETEKVSSKLRESSIEDRLKVDLSLENAKRDASKAEQLAVVEAEKVEDLQHLSSLVRDKAEADQIQSINSSKSYLAKDELESQTEALTKRFEAMQSGFHEALLALSNQDALVKIAQAGSVQTMLGGSSLVELVENIVGDGSLTDKIKEIAKRTGVGVLNE